MSDWTPVIDRLQSFCDEEWSRVEREYAGRLHAYVSRRVPDKTAREDVVQEAFLGAVRGIATFDCSFTFEQYLFGICRNRTIDHLRRRKSLTPTRHDEDGDHALVDEIVMDDQTPSGIVREEDLRGAGRALLVEMLRDWVQETWEAGEFTRLMVIEALFAGGWRNRDTWQRFELRDETAVAGIKFRALKRLRELAAPKDPGGMLSAALAERAGDGEAHLDVATLWREARVSCPARHWLARHMAGTLEEGPAAFVGFHLTEMECPWCQANLDDLEASEQRLEPLLEKVRHSTARYLRSRTT